MISRRACIQTLLLVPGALAVACSSKSNAPPPDTVSVEKTWTQILLAATDAVLGVPIPDHAHYERFLKYRYETLTPYKDVYLAFAGTLQRRARAEQHADFVALSPDARTKLVADVLEHDADGAKYDKYFRAEVLALFAKTDAFVMLGYDGWPGTSRSLDAVKNPPAHAAAAGTKGPT